MWRTPQPFGPSPIVIPACHFALLKLAHLAVLTIGTSLIRLSIIAADPGRGVHTINKAEPTPHLSNASRTTC